MESTTSTNPINNLAYLRGVVIRTDANWVDDLDVLRMYSITSKPAGLRVVTTGGMPLYERDRTNIVQRLHDGHRYVRGNEGDDHAGSQCNISTGLSM